MLELDISPPKQTQQDLRFLYDEAYMAIIVGLQRLICVCIKQRASSIIDVWSQHKWGKKKLKSPTILICILPYTPATNNVHFTPSPWFCSYPWTKCLFSIPKYASDPLPASCPCLAPSWPTGGTCCGCPPADHRQPQASRPLQRSCCCHAGADLSLSFCLVTISPLATWRKLPACCLLA